MEDLINTLRKRKLEEQTETISINSDDNENSEVTTSKNIKISDDSQTDCEPNLKVNLPISSAHENDFNIQTEVVDSVQSKEFILSEVVCVDASSLTENSDVEVLDCRKVEVVDFTAGDNESLSITVTNDINVADSSLNQLPNNNNNTEPLELVGVNQTIYENDTLNSELCANTEQPCLAKDLIATITFHNADDFATYKNNFVNILKTTLKFNITEKESALSVEIYKDDDIDHWIIIDEANEHQEKTKKRHKRKKKKAKVNDELFVLDTTPNIIKSNNLVYQSKFNVSLNETNDPIEENSKPFPPFITCFNCDGNHTLRECSQPKNLNKINAQRQNFKPTRNKTTRYHLEDEQRFGNIQPGKISDQLRYALGLRDDQLPDHIYKMRQLGYPPGWFEELQINEHSNLLIFDFQGKNDFKVKVTGDDVDQDKIVEYAGFNVPMGKGVKDEFRLHGCPQYSNQWSKPKMLDYARKMSIKSKDNLEPHDMELDEQQLSPKTVCSKVLFQSDNCSSPTLNDLETEKEKLLSLIDANDDSLSNSTLIQLDNSAIHDTPSKADEVKNSDSNLESTIKNQCSSPIINAVKHSSFGTPILKSLSPFSGLPKSENFQQDVSDIINFENLPNSTGKYEQMVGVLDKVRKQMKRLNSL